MRNKNMRITIVASLLALEFCAPVMAADGPTDFTGAYFGAQLGQDQSHINGYSSSDTAGKSAIGVQGGYNWNIDEFVVGATGYYTRNQSKCVTIAAPGTPPGTNVCYGSEIFGLGGKAGYRIGNLLPYLKAGFARVSGTADARDSSDTTPFYGIGLEYRVLDTMSLGIEWTKTKAESSGPHGSDYLHDSVIMVGLNYYFDAAKESAPARTAQAPAPRPAVEASVIEPARTQAKTSPVEKSLEEKRTVTMNGVNFAFKSATLKTSAYTMLDQVVRFAKAHPEANLDISGHTDDTGKDWPLSKNQQLSEERAQAVKNYLVSKGVDPARITANGYSYTRPVTDNSTEEGRTKNRRIEIRATYTAFM